MKKAAPDHIVQRALDSIQENQPQARVTLDMPHIQFPSLLNEDQIRKYM